MEVKRTFVSNCSPQLYRKFKALNYRKRGEMKPTLMSLRRRQDFNIIYYAEEDGKIVSWALSFYDRHADRSLKVLSTHVYTRRWSRGKGAGFKVFEALKEYCKETGHGLAFHPWNEQSNIYFTKCMKSSDVKIELRYYAPPNEVGKWRSYCV